MLHNYFLTFYEIIFLQEPQNLHLIKTIRNFETPDYWLNPLLILEEPTLLLMTADSFGNLFVAEKENQGKFKVHLIK